MKTLSFLALLIACLSLGLAYVAYQENGHDQGSVAREQQVNDRVTALEKQLAKATDDNKALRQSVAALEAKPAPTPAPAVAASGGMSEQQVKDLVQSELRQQMQQFRNRGPGGQGGQNGPGGNMPTTEEIRTVLKDQVGVEGEKADQAIKMMEEFRTSVRDIWTNNKGGSRDQNVALMREAEKKAETDLATVLDEGQMAKLKTWRDQLARRGGRRGPGGNNANGGDPTAAPAPAADF